MTPLHPAPHCTLSSCLRFCRSCRRSARRSRWLIGSLRLCLDAFNTHSASALTRWPRGSPDLRLVARGPGMMCACATVQGAPCGHGSGSRWLAGRCPPVPGCGVHSPRAPGENLGFAIRVPSFKKDLGLSWFLGSKAVNARKPVGGTVAPRRLQVPEPRSLGACTRRKGTRSKAGLWLPTLRALQTRRELRREKPVACSGGRPRQSRICPALSPLLFTSPEQPLGPRALRLGLGAGVGCPTAAVGSQSDGAHSHVMSSGTRHPRAHCASVQAG